jgi:hypothetical protein
MDIKQAYKQMEHDLENIDKDSDIALFNSWSSKGYKVDQDINIGIIGRNQMAVGFLYIMKDSDTQYSVKWKKPWNDFFIPIMTFTDYRKALFFYWKVSGTFRDAYITIFNDKTKGV